MYREDILWNNYKAVQASLAQAAQHAGRNPNEITLLAVTKYAKDEDVLALLKKGVLTDIGESRVQQAWARWKEDPRFAQFTQVKKHFIGHLQTNKAAKAAQLFDYVDSLDHWQTAQALAKHIPAGKRLNVLVQVKLTQRDTQSGLALPAARALAKEVRNAFENIRVCGYMAVAPQGADAPTLQALFRPLAQAFKEDFSAQSGAHLSLGMSADFKIAVAQGSTLPRIGSLLFERNLEGI